MTDIKDIPEGWTIIPFGEICEKMTNGSSAKQYDEKIGLPISRIETIWNETIDKTRVKYIAENDPEFISKYALKKNDILFSHINSDLHLGKTAIYNDQFQILIHGINLLLLRIKSNVDPKFVNYQLNYKRRKGDFIAIAQKSVNQSSINQAKLKKQDFILPPHEIQQAIVSKIEELFSELDKGIAELKLAHEQLKVYRQSVLKYAFEGRLTNENVKDGELPEGWKINDLKNVIEKPKYGTSKKCDYNAVGKGVLRIPNIVKGVVDSNDLKFAEFDEKEIQTYQLKKDDLLIIRSNGSVDIVGKCAIISSTEENFLYAGYLIRLRPIQGKILGKYLLYALNTIELRKQIESKAKSTSGVNNINSEEISTLQISLAPFSQQDVIVKEIESRLSVADKMEESITESLQKAEALRQSILKKAFSGELITEVNYV